MTGTTTVQKASFNFSGSRFSPVMSHVNASVDHIERPLMTPDEVMRLRPPKKEGSGDSEVITEPGDMLIFVSGHFPILGMQMLYFADPELARRSAIPPPETTQRQLPAKQHPASPFVPPHVHDGCQPADRADGVRWVRAETKQAAFDAAKYFHVYQRPDVASVREIRAARSSSDTRASTSSSSSAFIVWFMTHSAARTRVE